MSEPATAASESTELSGSEVLAGLTSAQRSAWQMTGELPEPKPDTAPVVAADPDDDEAEPVEAPKADAAPVEAPKPTTPPVSKRQQQINDLHRRAAAAEQELAALKARIEAPKQAEQPAKAPEPTRAKPTEAEYDTYPEFVEALAEWKYEQRAEADRVKAEAAQQTQRQAQQQQHEQQRLRTFAERASAFAAKNPAFDEKAVPFLNSVPPGTPLYDTLADSPVGPELALFLAEHPEELTRIGALTPIAALRELGKLEARYEQTADTSASAGPVATQVTKAPAPPVTLGARPAEPADPFEAAMRSGDFRAYEAAANRRDLARK